MKSDIWTGYKANQFWKQVKLDIIPQEIGFDGIQDSVGRSTEYKKTVSTKEGLLAALKDRSLDSCIILNSWFFGKTIVTSDYERIKEIKRKFGTTADIVRPSEFIDSLEADKKNRQKRF